MGDYDIMTQDDGANEKYGLRNLRIGDFVLLEDCDNYCGRGYMEGSVSIGIIIHSDCIAPGHGPGVTVMMTCRTGQIVGVLDKDANLMNYL